MNCILKQLNTNCISLCINFAMKLLVCSAILLFFCIGLHAQMDFGVKMGYNIATGIYSPKDKVGVKSISAFQVGILSEIEINRILFSSNLLFSQKGNYLDDTKNNVDAGNMVTYRLNYLETDLLLGYRFKLSSNSDLSVTVGPYIGIGLSGTEKGKGTLFGGPLNIDRKIYFSNSKNSTYTQNYIRPIDFGLDFNASLKYKKYFLYLNFNRGFSKRGILDYSSTISKNQVLSIGFGYLFKTRKKISKVACYNGK